MTKKLIFFSIVMLILLNSSNAQKYNGNWDKTEADKKEIKKFTNNFYFTGGFTPMLSIYNYYYVYNSQDSPGDPIEIKKSDKQQGLSIIELETGFRYNVFNYHDFFSISLSFTPSLGLGDGGAGILTINSPLGIDFNFFNHSTFNNIDNAGFTLSGGFQRHNIFPKDYIDVAGNIKWNDLYGRFTFKYRKYKNSFGDELKKKKYYYSYFALQYSTTNQDLVYDLGSDTEKFTCFKIVFGKIFGY